MNLWHHFDHLPILQGCAVPRIDLKRGAQCAPFLFNAFLFRPAPVATYDSDQGLLLALAHEVETPILETLLLPQWVDQAHTHS